jgi:ADP-ribose pyrophosphatase YjhB (NUDIX family)
VQRCLPIVCVDVLACRRENGILQEVGLIRRNTPHQGVRWCLIGGRMQYGESIVEAIGREIREALGDRIEHRWSGIDEPLKLVQYMPTLEKGEYHDPRQHAISLIYAVEVLGTPVPQGEALDFKWFKPGKVPSEEEMGFGKGAVVADLIERLNLNHGVQG